MSKIFDKLEVFGTGSSASSTALTISNSANAVSFLVKDDGEVVAKKMTIGLGTNSELFLDNNNTGKQLSLNSTTGSFNTITVTLGTTGDLSRLNTNGGAWGMNQSLRFDTAGVSQIYVNNGGNGLRLVGSNGSTNDIFISNNGKVGVGTNSPGANFHTYTAESTGSTVFKVSSAIGNILDILDTGNFQLSNGNVGIGTSPTSTEKFFLSTSSTAITTALAIEMGKTSGNNRVASFYAYGSTAGDNTAIIATAVNGANNYAISAPYGHVNFASGTLTVGTGTQQTSNRLYIGASNNQPTALLVEHGGNSGTTIGIRSYCYSNNAAGTNVGSQLQVYGASTTIGLQVNLTNGLTGATNYGLQVNSTLSGDTNYGLYINSTTATNNYGVIVANGKSGFGSAGPETMIESYTATGYGQFRLKTSYTPTSSGDTNGFTGEMVWDDSYIYIRTSSGWKRASLSSF